jgi:hypothetical protein
VFPASSPHLEQQQREQQQQQHTGLPSCLSLTPSHPQAAAAATGGITVTPHDTNIPGFSHDQNPTQQQQQQQQEPLQARAAAAAAAQSPGALGSGSSKCLGSGSSKCSAFRQSLSPLQV